MYIFLLIFSILYIIDNKPINIIIDFIGIIISISIILININIYDVSFISIILIIIYASALAIIFGFIVMLFNNKSLEVEKENIWKNTGINVFYLPLKLILNKKTNEIKLVKSIYYIIITILLLVIIYNINKKYIPILELSGTLLSEKLKIYEPKLLFINNNELYNIYYSFFNYFFNQNYFHIYIIIFINILLSTLIGIIYIIL